ncbi:MAG: hypothetical protein D6731_13090 [Planctomycetota bacterium]|nr:MAG: hypothetical protein D6731_13090 [Planctomycetota bacterium]
MNYMPSLRGAVAVKAWNDDIVFQSKTKDDAAPKGGKGTLLLGIFVAKGKTIGGEGRSPTRVELSAPKGVAFDRSEVTVPEALSHGRKLLQLRYSVAPDAASGEVRVKVTYQPAGAEPRVVTFSVPVAVK